jgi:predicted transcriptional regulator
MLCNLKLLLERGISAVRVGNPAKIREDLRWASLEGRAEASSRGQQAATLRVQSEELRAEAEAGKAARPPMDGREVGALYAQSREKWKLADTLMEQALTNALEGSQVVMCTCSGAASALLEPYRYRVVLIDEATQVRIHPPH